MQRPDAATDSCTDSGIGIAPPAATGQSANSGNSPYSGQWQQAVAAVGCNSQVAALSAAVGVALGAAAQCSAAAGWRQVRGVVGLAGIKKNRYEAWSASLEQNKNRYEAWSASPEQNKNRYEAWSASLE